MSADAEDQRDGQQSADANAQLESGEKSSGSALEEKVAQHAQVEQNQAFPALPEWLETGTKAIENAAHGVDDVAGHAARGLSDAVGKIWEEAKGSFENLRDMDPAERLSNLAQIGILAAKIGMNAGGMADVPNRPAAHDNANQTIVALTYRDTPGDKPDSDDGIDSPSDDLDAYQTVKDQANEESAARADELSQEQRQPHQHETRPGEKAPDEHLSRTQEKRLAHEATVRGAGQDAYRHSGRPR